MIGPATRSCISCLIAGLKRRSKPGNGALKAPDLKNDGFCCV
jgi:hypothetical protein